MAEPLSLGRWVKQRRRALDLTQETLAEQCACSVETIRKLEADARRPSRETAARLAVALQIPPQEQAAFVRRVRQDGRDERQPPSSTEFALTTPWGSPPPPGITPCPGYLPHQRRNYSKTAGTPAR